MVINESYKVGRGYITLWNASDVLSYYGSLSGATVTAVEGDISLKNFARIFINEKQIVETLYSYSDSEEYMHNRPLSKLTKDILLQIGVEIESL